MQANSMQPSPSWKQNSHSGGQMVKQVIFFLCAQTCIIFFHKSQPTYYILYVIQCCDLHYLPAWKRAWLTHKTLKNKDTSSFSTYSRMYFLPEYLMQNLVFLKLQYQTEGHSVYNLVTMYKENKIHCLRRPFTALRMELFSKIYRLFLVEDIPLCLK
jgi:hypothetical protein